MAADTVLFAPSAERLATTNGWALLHWLRTVHFVDLADWSSLLEWVAAQPGTARRAIRAFAGLDGAQQAKLPEATIPHLAELLLFLDLRPDDHLLVADAQAWPWQAVGLTGAAMTRYTGPAATILEAAAATEATVLAVPAQWLDTGSFQRRQRLDLRGLRTILTLGGPLSIEAAGRIYAWVKSDLLLLARAGDRVWGDPLGPVLAKAAIAPSLSSLLRRSSPMPY